MEMILDRLDNKIAEMKELRRLEEIKNNKSLQDNTDQKYRILVCNMHAITESISYLHQTFGFNPSETISNKISPLYTKMGGIIKNGLADDDTVNECQVEYKEIMLSISKEWKQYYKEIAGPTIGTLNIIGNITNGGAIECKDDILKAESWPTTNAVKTFRDLCTALHDADALIKTLDLDQDIVIFLEKMNANRATIMDLDNKILSWIRKNNLDKKVKLSFAIR